MTSKTVCTDIGMQKIANASAGGFLINIRSFKVTTATGFDPQTTDTGLVGTPVFTGNIINIASLSRGLVKFVCEIPPGFPSDSSTVQLGEIALFTDNGDFFAHGLLDPTYYKRKDLGLRITLIVSAINIGLVVSTNVSVSTSIPSYPFVPYLPNPLDITENALSVLDGFTNKDGTKSPTIAMKYGAGGERWGFAGWDKVYENIPVSFTNTALEVPVSFTDDFTDNEAFLVQIVSGTGAGQTRRMRFSKQYRNLTEMDNVPFVGVDATSKVVVWRTPHGEIAALKQALQLNIDNLRWADTFEYNQIADAINKVVAAPTGTTYPDVYGYDQTPLVRLVPGQHPTADMWHTVYTYLDTYFNHQNATVPGLTPDTFMFNDGYKGGETHRENWLALKSAVDTLTANRNLFVPAQMVSQIPSGGTIIRTTDWVGVKTHVITLTFADQNALLGYFNAGGSITTYANMTNFSGPRAADWNTLLIDVGQVVINSEKTTPGDVEGSGWGIHDILANSAQLNLIYRKRELGANTGIPLDYAVWAQILNNVLVLQIDFDDRAGTYSYDAGYVANSVHGTLTSSIITTKPSSDSLPNPPVAYPAVVSTGTLLS